MRGSATNSEYFVFSTFDSWYDYILIYFTKNPEICWATKKIDLKSGDNYKVSKICYEKQ